MFMWFNREEFVKLLDAQWWSERDSESVFFA